MATKGKKKKDFWSGKNRDDYPASAEGLDFLDEKKTQKFIRKGTTFEVTAVRDGVITVKGKEKDVTYVDIFTEDGDEYTKTFAANAVPGRVKLLGELREFLEEGGDPVECQFVQEGRSIMIVPSDGSWDSEEEEEEEEEEE